MVVAGYVYPRSTGARTKALIPARNMPETALAAADYSLWKAGISIRVRKP